MKKTIILLLAIFINFVAMSQSVMTKNKMIIKHGDITLYLSNDTLPMVSRHTINYSKFKLDSDRDNKWFQDKYKKMDKNAYKN